MIQTGSNQPINHFDFSEFPYRFTKDGKVIKTDNISKINNNNNMNDKNKASQAVTKRGGAPVGKRKYPLSKAFKLKNPKELDQLAENDENAVIFFYKDKCPYCVEFAPLYNYIATEIHRTNRKPGSVPIIMAKIDGNTYRDIINDKQPGFLTSFPTILFKRGTGDSEVFESDQRTFVNILQKMAQVFQDDSLMPHKPHLEYMTNQKPKFVYYLNPNVPMIDRFKKPMSPYMTDITDGSLSISAELEEHPEIQKDGLAIDTIAVNRKDIKVPSFWDNRVQKEHAYRQAVQFMNSLLEEYQ